MGWREVSMMRTAVLRLCGHDSGEPSGVDVQSNARIIAPSSPPPARNALSLTPMTALIPLSLQAAVTKVVDTTFTEACRIPGEGLPSVGSSSACRNFLTLSLATSCAGRPGQAVDGCHQLGGIHRLGEMSLESGALRLRAVFLAGICSQGDGGDPRAAVGQ